MFKMQLNETKHIITDCNIDLMIDNILSALEYNMWMQAIKGDINFSKYQEKFIGAGIDPRSAGRDFNEYLNLIDNERKEVENKFKFPIFSEFQLTDAENPCKKYISSDCTYIFRFDEFLAGNVIHNVNLDNAFVSEGILHNVTFTFESVFGDINALREGIRHEIKHVYDELLKHRAKSENGKIGEFKNKNDNERDKIYSAVINALSKIYKDNSRLDFRQRKERKSMEVLLKSLYLLYDSEIQANYSEYYQEIINSPERLFTNHEAYQKYYNLSNEISIGSKIESDPDETGLSSEILIDVFDDDQCFENIKKYATKILKCQKNFNNKDELKNEILKRINNVLGEMKKIYKIFVTEKKSTEELYKESYNSYFNEILNSLQESYDEADGLYRFTMRRYYGKEDFEKKIDLIHEMFKNPNQINNQI